MREGGVLEVKRRRAPGYPFPAVRAFCFSFICVVCYCLFFPLFASAEERVVSLDDAYRMAFASHERVKIAEESLLQARAGVGIATARMLPSVVAEGSYTQFAEQKRTTIFLLQPDKTKSFNLRVTQPLFAGGTLWSGRKQARMAEEGSKLGMKATKEVVMLDTGRAYFNVLKAERNLQIKEAALKRAGERRKVASSRYEVGEVTKSVLLRAEAEVAGAEADLMTARNLLNDSMDLLKRIIGVEGEIAVADPSLHPHAAKGAEELIEEAIKARRDYRQTLIEENIAHEGVKSARGGFLPTLSLEGLYSGRDQEPSTTFLLNESVSGTLLFSYPLFEGGLKRAELKEAKSRRREAALRRTSLRRDIELEVRSSLNTVETFKAVTASYKKQLDFSQENYAMVFKQFKYGLATSVDVIDADTILVEAQSGLMSARYDLQIALQELKFAVGTLLDEWER